MSSASIDTRAFRNALGAFTTGVTIVTTRDGTGQDVGLTVNSFNSVSLDPPLVLWSLAKNSGSLKAFADAEYFAVHILAADQEALSNLFATRGGDKFGGLEPGRGHGGIPLLDGCTARFECRAAFRHDGGDHEIFVGEVLTFEHFSHPPLVFQGGKYALALKKAALTAREAAHPREYTLLEYNTALNVLLGMAYHQLNLNFLPALEQRGLREEEYWILSLIGAEEGRTIARLDELVAFTGKRATVALMQDLQRRGLVSMAGEGMEAKASLSKQGRSMVIEMAAINKVVEDDAEEALDYAEARLLRQLLQQVIRSAFKHQPGKIE